jgi:hypothetical protein
VNLAQASPVKRRRSEASPASLAALGLTEEIDQLCPTILCQRDQVAPTRRHR